MRFGHGQRRCCLLLQLTCPPRPPRPPRPPPRRPSSRSPLASDARPERSSRPLCVSGVTDYLSAEISTSKQKKFSLLTFVDTPGLVDGDMVYPFNVNSAITWLGMSLQPYAFFKDGAFLEHFRRLFVCRRAGRPDLRVLRPDGSGPLQAHPQHRGEAE